MVVIFAAGTVLINPPDAAVLTLEQVWNGLELKRSKPQLFLKVIDTCEVLEGDRNAILREVKFKDGPPMMGVKVKERITHISPVTPTAGSGIEIFLMIGSASRVLNIVSTGNDGELYLTFTFEWEHKEIEAGSQEEKDKQAAYQGTATKGMEGTLEAIRGMVERGEL